MENLFLAAAASIAAVFGGMGGGDHRMPPPDRNQIKIHASTTGSSAINIACVAAAVAAREASLGSAASTNAQALTSAYSARASALATAYAQTGNDSIKKAVKSAWSTFGAALRLAHRGWKNAQQSAWTQFKTAVKACGASAATIADTSNASVDASAGAGAE